MRVKQILYCTVTMLLFISVIALMTACEDNSIKEGEQDDFVNENIIITVTSQNITPITEKISLTIENKTNKELSYSKPYVLQQKKDGEWNDVHLIDSATWVDDTFTVPKGKSSYTNLLIQNWYGELEQGEYRIVIEFLYDGGKTRGAVNFFVN